MNQIVPQTMIGRCLAHNDDQYVNSTLSVSFRFRCAYSGLICFICFACFVFSFYFVCFVSFIKFFPLFSFAYSVDGRFNPEWEEFEEWVIQAQYYWQTDEGEQAGSKAMCGPLVKVAPGGE